MASTQYERLMRLAEDNDRMARAADGKAATHRKRASYLRSLASDLRSSVNPKDKV